LDLPAALFTAILSDTVATEERKLESPVQFAFARLYASIMWDVLVPFNNTAKPILAAAQLPRQPASARTNRNMNTVKCYGLLQLIRWSLPSAVPKFTRLMDSLKLDPDATTGMAGIGNTVADAWRQHVLEVCTQLLQPDKDATSRSCMQLGA